MEDQFQGKVALISGCSQGLGYYSALALAKQGVKIFGISIGDDQKLKDEILKIGGQYDSITSSLTTPNTIRLLIKDCLATYGKIDILLNFAGMMRKHSIDELTKKEWQDVFDLNVNVPFFLAQEVIKQFIKQGTNGKILYTSCVLPKHSSDYMSFYASKGAVEAFAKYQSVLYAQNNIQINTIVLGLMDERTSLLMSNEQELDQSYISAIPSHRYGRYEDCLSSILWLCCESSNYVNGQLIYIDGGYTIR